MSLSSFERLSHKLISVATPVPRQDANTGLLSCSSLGITLNRQTYQQWLLVVDMSNKDYKAITVGDEPFRDGKVYRAQVYVMKRDHPAEHQSRFGIVATPTLNRFRIVGKAPEQAIAEYRAKHTPELQAEGDNKVLDGDRPTLIAPISECHQKKASLPES